MRHPEAVAGPSGRDIAFPRVAFAALVAMLSSAIACSSSPRSIADAGRDGSADVTHDAPESDRARDAANEPREASAPIDAGAPSLTELAISPSTTADGSPPVALVPPFSPGTHDYYVRCSAGPNQLDVTMTASYGSTSLLTRPNPSPSRPTQTVSLTVYENQAIVAAATNGVATTEYWVRCLPHDFPPLHTTRQVDAGAVPDGYYLVGNYQPVPGMGAYAMVLDGNGVPVWYSFVALGYVGDVDSLVDGSISFASASQEFELHQLSPPRTSYAAPSGTVLDIHELRVLSNGHYLVISNPVRSGVDLTGVHISLPDGGVETFGPSSSIQDCNLVEFDPSTGAVVWQWVGFDHLDPVKDSTVSRTSYNAVTGPDGGQVVDSFHCNSIDVDPGNGNLLVSGRHMDSIFYVDRSTGAIAWKMGGSSYTKDGARYVAVADPFYRQHDARLQPGWSSTCSGGIGQISIFDDQSFESAPARAVVYDVLVGTGDGGTDGCDGAAPDAAVPAGTATVVWQRRGAASSTGMGSFRISADGSRVIGWGFGPPNPVFTEVDAKGNEVFEVGFADGNSSARAVKVSRTALDLTAMRNAAGSP